VDLKKNKEYRFTFQDHTGKLRVVFLQAQHFAAGAKEQVKILVTSDGGVPCELDHFIDKDVTTRSARSGSML